MKHIKIVLSLLVVVVLFTGLVFVVESYTTPLIQERLTAEANEAKFEVLPALAEDFDLTHEVPEITDDYDLTGTTILSIFYESGYGYIYEAEFQGYQSKIRYMIGVSEAGEITGLKVLEQGDTPGLGAEIANPDNWVQFVGMSTNAALNGEIDGLSGATITTDGWKDSLAKVMDFHLNTVLGFTYTDITSSVGVSGVTNAQEVSKDGTVLEVIYTVEFESNYSNGANVYNVTFRIGEGIKKLEVVTATDTDIYGAHIADPEFAEQFTGMTIDSALNSEYDDLGGATYPVTLEAFAGTFDSLVAWHNVEYEGAMPETFEEMVARYKEEVSVKGGTFVDVSADYDIEESYITKVEEVTPDGETEATHLVVSFTFPGHVNPIDAIAGINIADGKLNGLRITAQNETEGIGDRILEEDFLAQFDNLSILGAKYGVYDAIGGSSSTTGTKLTDGFDNIISWYENTYLGTGVELTEAQILYSRISAMYPDVFSIVSITNDYDRTGTDVEMAFEVYDFNGIKLGTVFVVECLGASYGGSPTYLEYVVAINDDNTFGGFMLYSQNETGNDPAQFESVEYAEQIIGLDIEELAYPVDQIDTSGGSTITNSAILTSLEKVARFFIEGIKGEVFNRPDPLAVSDSIVLLAYPDADHVESVYLDYAYEGSIGNMFAAYDEFDVLLGYVYIFTQTGNNGAIYMSLGVDLSGTTQELVILVESETWENSPYTGTESLPDILLLTQYEGVALSTFITTDANVDDYAGVTITTTAIETGVTIVAEYHEENVGGGS